MIVNASRNVSKKGYYNTRDAAWRFLIENDVRSYPLDLKGILLKHGWRVLDKQKYIASHPELKKYASPAEAITVELEGKYIILIDGENSSFERNRFTIAHEIGHIYLQHVGKSKKLIEKEANMFAARILMPMVLIEELHITSAEELAELCQVSIEAATFRINRYKGIKARNKFYTSPFERQLCEQLKEFIQRSK